ncbi:type III-A CRISPR-associated RAMP protein Csm4 [Methanocaldococcus infernus]
MKLVELKPATNSKFHFGNGRLERTSSIFHSSSLFSAIVNNYIKLYGNFDDKLKNIKLSSLLYKINLGNKDIYLIPKPEHPTFYKIYRENKEEVKIAKKVKKIRFFSINAYKEFINKYLKEIKNNEKIIWKNIVDEQLLGNIILTKEEMKLINKKEFSLFSTFEEQKVAIDRIKNISLEMNERGQLYTVEFLKLNENVSFYFLIDGLDKEIEASIKLIEDEGLGGKRSSGAGFFEKVCVRNLSNDFKDLFKEDYEYALTLGLGIPENEFSAKYYKIVELGGFCYYIKSDKIVNKLKPNMLAISEGSVVKKDFIGKVEDLKIDENNSLYIHGNPLLLPFY